MTGPLKTDGPVPFFPFKSKKIQKKAENGIAKHQKRCIVLYLSALVAQLDRAIASGAIGREFEPRRVHHFLPQNPILSPYKIRLFSYRLQHFIAFMILIIRK